MKRPLTRLAAAVVIALISISATAQLPPPVAVLTQRYNNQRTGTNDQERVLTVDAVSSSEFQQLYSIPVTGQVYAQPLLYEISVPCGRDCDPGHTNILIIATMHNDVSAFAVDDAIGGGAFAPKLLWSVNIGTAVPSNFMAMAYSDWITVCGAAALCFPQPDAPGSPKALPPVGSPPGHTTWFGYADIANEGLYNINPTVGILSTPVIDPASGTVFVVGKVNGGSGPENDLVAISLATGAIVGKKTITAASFNAAGALNASFDQNHQMQRPALLLQNGSVYVGFGSHQDTPPWHGWILRFDASSLNQLGAWCSTPTSGGGSIWQAGSGLAGDASGNVYAMTGNGCNLDPNGHCGATEWPFDVNAPPDTSFDGITNFANTFVQLSPDLKQISAVSPADEAHRDSEDLDLGSAGPVLIPGTSDLLGGDKEGLFFVLATAPTFKSTQVFQAAAIYDSIGQNGNVSVQGSGYHHIHGSPVLWRGPEGLTAYVWPERDYLRAFQWDDSLAAFACSLDPSGGCELGNTTVPDQVSSFTAPMCCHSMPGGSLTLSADGHTSGTGVLWASLHEDTEHVGGHVALLGGALNQVLPGVFHAFDAEDIQHDLWNSDINPGRDGSYMYAKYNPPMVANGRVYLATFGSIPNGGSQSATGTVNIYGLKEWAKLLTTSFPSGQLAPGGQFQASISFLNAGTTAWSRATYSLALVSDPSRAPPGTPTALPLPNDVPAGGQLVVNVSLPRATTPGTYLYQWQVSENSGAFGEKATGAIQVGGRFVETTEQNAKSKTTTIAVADALANLPVNGATVTVAGKSLVTGSSSFGPGQVVIPTPACTGPKIYPKTGNVYNAPAPCPGTVSKAGYADLSFWVPIGR